ncbi:3-isopropylmalate dehydratase [Ignisphaera aggregans DSM 17230]|uniref:3-isopropylmalate dehydratase large subunit n=1 Tax=Ignisphaera aggregans (strain DSM 17230 / JCM 13409 / AQ1.S1) TaxID=583356 RepID=E0SSB5_IGNAA|nr:3-isopropylmalate dehydratase [Ignisphaera aggregans DSM 17230]
MGLIDRIISKAIGRDVTPGEIVVTEIDAIYAQDGTAPLVINVIEKELNADRLEAWNRTYFFIDHSSPAPHVAAATVHREMRRFCRKFNIKLFDVGYGISHQVVVEDGIVRPGMIVIGADSHTPTIGALGIYALGVGSTDAAIGIVYGKTWIKVPETFRIRLIGKVPRGVMSKDIILSIIGTVGSDGMIGRAVEFHGDTIKELSIDARMTLTNMCTEMSAESAIIPLDERAIQWLESNGYSIYRYVDYSPSSKDFVDEMDVEVQKIGPVVSAPPDVDNVKSVAEVEGIEIDQVFIGSCTNGRLEDLEIAARIMKGRKVREGIRCIVSPASRKIYLEALRRGIIDILTEANCVIAPPTCGPCVGAHMGILAENEVAIATTNRNFTGRMGHKNSKVYLSSPATAAASAIEGRITDPRKYLS